MHDLVTDNHHRNFTFGTRFIMFSGIFGKNFRVAHRGIGFVPIAVLTAIIVPAVLIDPANQYIAITDNPRLIAAFVAIAVALITRQVITTIGAGLATLWALQWLFRPTIKCAIGITVSGHYQPPFYRKLQRSRSSVVTPPFE